MSAAMLPRSVARAVSAGPPVVVGFHRSRLQSEGVERTIAGVNRPGRPPFVSIQVWHRGVRGGRLLVYGEHRRMVERAVDFAMAGEGLGRFDFGEMPLSRDGSAIRVWAKIDHARGGLVLFGRVSETGEHLGRPTTLVGAELGAMRRALEWLKEITT